MKRCLQSRERGVTLIEVLIATLVLSIGMLGLAGLYLNALRASQDMRFRVLASIAAEDMGEHIRIMGDAGNADAYLIEWQADLGNRLPGGQGAVVPGTDTHVVTVTWDQRARARDASDAIAPRQSFSHEVRQWQ
ncbi:type IV pilus modification protein PilV [Thiocapsa roseopersicina]|uniref:Type IV pilus assembly protein PilV n=1 Tax=Thiocapsa roseopersicina TaxID=1058 RepID=A0A1H3BJ14_THIRO|nr:type IV pilus modification protein PilV [Thiocapsa roseopersicina]SDX41933.1 type IV pilus assembly protein PilV [Thiocapsa roseopersicina]